jgi:hypothetical protein
MSYPNFRAECHSLSSLLNFIIPELDYSPRVLLSREAWTPVYAPAQKFVNEICLNPSLTEVPDDYDWRTIIADHKVDLSKPREKYSSRKLILDTPQCIRYIVSELWRSSIFSKRYYYTSMVGQLIGKDERSFEWVADSRADIESVCYLTFKIFNDYFDTITRQRKSKKTQNQFTPMVNFKVYLVNNDISPPDFLLLLKLLKKLVYNEISSKLYFSLINYRIELTDSESDVLTSVIKESLESDDSGIQLSFIVRHHQKSSEVMNASKIN